MKSFLLLPIFCCCANFLSAQIFINNIAGTNPNTSNPYTTGQSHDANIAVSGIGRGPGIAGANGNDRYNADNWTTSATIDLDDYFYFTLTANTGYGFSLSGFTYTGTAAVSGPASFSFRSNKDNYATSIGAPSAAGTTIDLALSQFQNITSVTFRFYGFNASSTNGNFSINDFRFDGTVYLPIELVSFQAEKMPSGHVSLLFETASESGNSHFSIERSANGVDFSEIGRLDGAGTSAQKQAYSFTDEQPFSGKNYYRLRQVDFDGKTSLSKIVVVDLGSKTGMNVVPNPVSAGQIRVNLEAETSELCRWQIHDFTGKTLREGWLEAEQTGFDVEVGDLPSGSYLVRLAGGLEAANSLFVKQ